MYYVDTHAHIYKEYYEDINNIINNAKKQNVLKIINCSVDLFTAEEVINLQNKYKGIIYSAIGIHPEYANSVQEKDLKQIKNLIENNQVYAIGEIGLDYHYDSTNKEKQKELFKYFLNLASINNLPVIIHSREANQDVIELLKQYEVNGVIHSFSGTAKDLKEFLNLGFLIGINGIATFKNAQEQRDVLKGVPLDKILLETDSPYLTPVPFRKFQNESKYIPEIGKKVAEILEESEKKVIKITTQNALNIFDLD